MNMNEPAVSCRQGGNYNEPTVALNLHGSSIDHAGSDPTGTYSRLWYPTDSLRAAMAIQHPEHTSRCSHNFSASRSTASTRGFTSSLVHPRSAMSIGEILDEALALFEETDFIFAERQPTTVPRFPDTGRGDSNERQ